MTEWEFHPLLQKIKEIINSPLGDGDALFEIEQVITTEEQRCNQALAAMLSATNPIGKTCYLCHKEITKEHGGHKEAFSSPYDGRFVHTSCRYWADEDYYNTPG